MGDVYRSQILGRPAGPVNVDGWPAFAGFSKLGAGCARRRCRAALQIQPIAAAACAGGGGPVSPPLDERLPPNPVVIEPLQEIGQYRGTTRLAIGNPNALFGDPQAVMGTKLILRIAPDLRGVGEGRIVACHFADELELAGAGAA